MVDGESPTLNHRARTSGWSKLGLRDRILVVIAPLVLIGVAVNQHILASTQKLNAWKGGGFGMFATVDSATERAIFAYGITRDGTIINDPTEPGLGALDIYSDKGQRAIVMPDDDTLRNLALSSLSYYQDPANVMAGREEIVGIRIEVVTLDYDSRTRDVQVKLLRRLEVFQS